MASSLIVNDVTRLNPTEVWAITTPGSVEAVQEALRRSSGAVSIGGGHFSMGGQVASPGSLHLDMRKLNQVLEFSPVRKTIRVQAGIRWCDIQRFIDPHGLAVKIMQTYANFTVGGSLSVNVHGRYIGLGPLILSVRSIRLVKANGELADASPTLNPELFYGAIGCYGALGVIVEAELDLADNCRVERVQRKLATADYADFFRRGVRDARETVFHNADLYAPHYRRARAVSWVETKKPATVPYRLQPNRRLYPLENYFLWAISETPFGKWRREYLVDPLLYLRGKVHWRNYEAGYDVAELEPPSRKRRTYVLQEYFVPVARFDEFVPKMAEILQRHRVNMLNISVRHALPDPGSLLAWAREEVFAFVMYYKQRTRENAKERVAVWTRELIDAVLACGGTYYLPYQPHATHEQFHRAYPRAHELFALKRRLDPDYRFRNVLWDKYYAPTLSTAEPAGNDTRCPSGDFHIIYDDTARADAFYRFLQNVFRLYPEDRFHTLIRSACRLFDHDEMIYRHLQEKLPDIKPLLADLFYALPSLARQKREMARQTGILLGQRKPIRGYVEIGTTGRYVAALKREININGEVILLHEAAASNSPIDIVERGGLRQVGRYIPLGDYDPIRPEAVPDASVDLVSCFIGLHHARPDTLPAFLASIQRILRPGGVFILRDHDVTTSQMHAFVALAHTVFNAGLGASWESNAAELRHFAPVTHWVGLIEQAGLRDSGQRLLQAHDPSDNVLMAFIKPEAELG
jgi:FAD/FMN-containing dehydrogenase/SAM-dependent methyltransferase